MFDFDVAIVGGGPAGTSTALHLARRERIAPARIAIFDKAIFPRDKPCGGAVSRWGLDALAAIGVPLEVPHVAVRGLRILHERDVGVASSRELGAVIRRREFDAALLGRTQEDGVIVRDGEALVGLSTVPGGWRLVTARGEVRAHLVAACDGSGSAVRKLLGIAETERKGHLYALETEPVSADVGPNDGLCDFDLSPACEGLEGYYWDFPALRGGARRVGRGIYHANFTPRRDVKEFLSLSLASRGIDIRDVALQPFSTRPFGRASALSAHGLVLVGEAAGIDAATGEGIAPAILMGRIAARHLARALRLSTGRLDGYARDVLGSRLGRHLLQSAWLARRAYGPRGLAFRRILARSAEARDAGARWYRGERLGWLTKAHLAASLAFYGIAPS